MSVRPAAKPWRGGRRASSLPRDSWHAEPKLGANPLAASLTCQQLHSLRPTRSARGNNSRAASQGVFVCVCVWCRGGCRERYSLPPSAFTECFCISRRAAHQLSLPLALPLPCPCTQSDSLKDKSVRQP